jgi:hypothetical protein
MEPVAVNPTCRRICASGMGLALKPSVRTNFPQRASSIQSLHSIGRLDVREGGKEVRIMTVHALHQDALYALKHGKGE